MAERKTKVKTKELVPTNEVRDIALKAEELIDKSNVFMQITTRGADPNSKSLVDFKVFDDAKLAKLAKNMPEINRATQAFGRQNSQATGKLMSLNMISQSPYRRLKQCLAKIERKRSALKENIFKLRKEKLKIDKLLYQKQKFEDQLIVDDVSIDHQEIEFKIQHINIQLQEKAANISDTNLYIEGALKEIGMYQDAYNEIKESYNIPDNWDENDFERCEVEEHVKTAFLHLIRDIEMNGRVNVGTHEYLEQYGVNPRTAIKLVQMYLANIEQMISEGKYANITVLYDFLDEMYNTFKDEYKHAMRRIGLKKLISEDYLYLEEKTSKDSV
ncbi:hypothetical protein LCGC14_1525000 [marine sediment metagenome]|uniref:Uncharacterized protein n=1 Tax=marine sediment metagenome TaxID=412755 RepID=A0A0F9JIC6_9ZZZZ